MNRLVKPLIFLCAAIWVFVAYSFAQASSDVVWTENIKPFTLKQTWGRLQGCPEVIDMKPTQLAPKGAVEPVRRALLTRLIGNPISKMIPSAGLVFAAVDMEGRRKSVSYAIDALMKNGQPVNPQTIQEWIAQNNGINTTAETPDGVVSGSTVTFDDRIYTFTSSQTQAVSSSWNPYTVRYMPCDGTTFVSTIPPGGFRTISFRGAAVPWPQTGYYWTDYTLAPLGGCNSVQYTSAPGFNPANHPELYSPENYPPNIITALESQGGLDSFQVRLKERIDADLADHQFVDIDALADDVSNTSPPGFWDIISQGLRFSIPDSLKNVFSDLLPKLSIDPTYTVNTPEGGQVVADKIRDLLRDWGIPEGSTLNGYNPETGSVSYTTPDGEWWKKLLTKDDLDKLTQNTNITNEGDRTIVNKNDFSTDINLPDVDLDGSLSPGNGTLEPVTPDRVQAAKIRFVSSWTELKDTVDSIFGLNLPGQASLPVWNWLILGKNIQIDFNTFSNVFNIMSLGFLFVALVTSLTVIFGR